MIKDKHAKVASTSIELTEKLKELKACQQQKDELLALIDELQSKNMLEQNASMINKKMAMNTLRFKKVLKDIEDIEDIDNNI